MTEKFPAGWRQVGVCFVLLAAVSMIASSWSVVAVPLADAFNPSRMTMGLVMTALAGVSALLAPFLGNLMDRISLRILMLTGAALLAAGFGVLSFAQSFNQVFIIFGLFMAPANVLLGPVAATVLLSRWFVKKRGTALGIAIAGVSTGSVIFPPLIQWLLDNHDWRAAFRLFALILAALILPAAAMVVGRPSDKGLHADGAAESPEAVNRNLPVASAKDVLSDPTFWLVVLVFSIVLSGMKGMVTNLAPLALDQGIKARDAALLISIFGGSGFVAKFAFATLADRVAPRMLLLAAIAGFAAGMAILTQAHLGYGVIAAGVVLIGFFGGFMVPLKSLLAPRIFGEKIVGKAMGLLSMASLMFLLTTPPLFGRIYDVTGSYSAIFITFAALAIASMLLVPAIRMQARPALQPA